MYACVRIHNQSVVSKAAATGSVMSGLVVKFPDGSYTEVKSSTTFGRGTPAALNDIHLSRQHLLLTPLEGQPQALLLTNQGQNGKGTEETYHLENQ